MKNLYITWHYTTHGVAYLKHILSQFYKLGGIPEKIYFDNLEQEELNTVFDNPQKGFVFDEIIYLTAPQQAFDNLSSRRFSYKKTILEDPLVEELGLTSIFEKIISDSICYNLEAELAFVKKNHPKKLKDFESVIWRNIQHYSVKEQIKWLTDYSNFKNVYDGKFKEVELKVSDLRDEKLIAEEVSRWANRYFSDKEINPIINVSLGSNETQVVWHILSEADQLPNNTRFIKTYDDKSDKPDKRFKRFSIKEIDTKLFSEIGSEFKIFNDAKSPSRLFVNKKMEVFLNSGFSILLIGERGIGKSQLANLYEKKHPNFKEANCASFEEDSKAESELFGYEKGAFTGANTFKKGLLEEADKGVLFLDEIHHLSKLVQAKLMKALQTDKNNKMSIRRMGSNNEIKIECKLIFATNESISNLRKLLLPDFYDRIVQHVIHIPPLRETVEDRMKDWENVWKGLRFGTVVPKELGLTKWIKGLALYGNFRDLQKIAIYYNAYNSFDPEMQIQTGKANAFQYAKEEFEKYHSPVIQNEQETLNFNINQTTTEMVIDYKFKLQDWAVKKFGSPKNASEHFESLGEKPENIKRNFTNWKNKK